MRILDILRAEIKCQVYCVWQLIRHQNPVCELRIYDENGNITMIATTKDSLWMQCFEHRKATIDKTFYIEE